MICRRHADTDQALEFCKSQSLLLILDTETPQDQLRIASKIVISAFERWRDKVAAYCSGGGGAVSEIKKQKVKDAFSDDVFGSVVAVAGCDDYDGASATSSAARTPAAKPLSISEGETTKTSRQSPSSTISNNNNNKNNDNDTVSLFGTTQDYQQSKIFRSPKYFFTVGFLRLRRLAHSRFRLRAILKRYRANRARFIDSALEQWRELELAARVSLPFDAFVLAFVPLTLRRQIIVDYHAACCHQCILFLRAAKMDRSVGEEIRKKFFVWAYHQRKVSSTTFRIAITTMLILQERARKRAWVRKLMGQEGVFSNSGPHDDETKTTVASFSSSSSSPSRGKSSRVASLLLAGCTAPTKWCMCLISLQSLAWVCALRRYKFQTIIDNSKAFFFSDLADVALQIKRRAIGASVDGESSNNNNKIDKKKKATTNEAKNKQLTPPDGEQDNAASTVASPSSFLKTAAPAAQLERTKSASSSTMSLSSLCSSNAEESIELDAATLALCFAPWVNAAVTATWFSTNLQHFAVRQLAGAQKNLTQILTEKLRVDMQQTRQMLLRQKEQQQQQQQQNQTPSSPSLSSPSRSSPRKLDQKQSTMQQLLQKTRTDAASPAVPKTEGLWASFVLSPELFAPFRFVDPSSSSHEDKIASASMRDRLQSMEADGTLLLGFANATLTTSLHYAKSLERAAPGKLQREYVFPGRRHFEEGEGEGRHDDATTTSNRNNNSRNNYSGSAAAGSTEQRHIQLRADAVIVSPKSSAAAAVVAATAATAARVSSTTPGRTAQVQFDETTKSAESTKSRSGAAAASAADAGGAAGSGAKGKAAAAAAIELSQGNVFSRQQLRIHRQTAFDYAHNFDFLFLPHGDDGLDADHHAALLHRARSSYIFAPGGGAAVILSPALRKNNNNKGATAASSSALVSASLQGRINSLTRSASVRLPTTRSFRGIRSSFSSVEAAKGAGADTGLALPSGARCPTLWGSLWVSDPHWEGEMNNMDTLFVGAKADSLYRRVLRLCVMTGALRITNPYLCRRLGRINQMMVAARMREEAQAAAKQMRRQRGNNNSNMVGRQQHKQQKQKQRIALLDGAALLTMIDQPKQRHESNRTPSPSSRNQSPLKKTRTALAVAGRGEGDEQRSGRMMWTAAVRKEPVVVCPLFGRTAADMGDLLGVSQHEAIKNATAMTMTTTTMNRHKKQQAAMNAVSPPEAVSTSDINGSAAAAFLMLTAPMFMAPARPSMPRSAKGSRNVSSISSTTAAAAAVNNNSKSSDKSAVEQQTTASTSRHVPAVPPPSCSNSCRNLRRLPAALSRPSSTLVSSRRSSSACSSRTTSAIDENRIVVVDDDVIAAETARCSAVAPAPPTQQPLRPIVRGAAQNRKRIVQTRAALGISGSNNNNEDAENHNSVPASAISQCDLSQLPRADGAFVIERSKLHEKNPDWLSREAPKEAPMPFGFNAGFPAMWRALEGRFHTGATALDSKPKW